MIRDIDFTRPPTAKESQKLAGRLHRLDRPEHIKRIENLHNRIPGTIPESGITVRQGFVFREDDLAPESSDRKAPPPGFRPPATRLMAGRGAALRFALTLITVVQANRRAGVKANVRELGIRSVGSRGTLGWTDLLSGDAVDSQSRDNVISAKDKRARSVRSALNALESAGLVMIPDDPGARGRYEDFVLLDDRGRDALGESDHYRVPRRAEAAFSLPREFITEGWLHVLEDSEIALLLMVACGEGGWRDRNYLVMPSEIRLRNYGIHRDSFSAARKTLEWFGLLEVEEVARHSDGRGEDGELSVHRLAIRQGAFDESGPRRVVTALEEQLSRR